MLYALVIFDWILSIWVVTRHDQLFFGEGWFFYVTSGPEL
jgi:hypothetical protein